MYQHISQINVFCSLHNYLYKSYEMHLDSVCIVYITYYFLPHVFGLSEPSSGTTKYKRKHIHICLMMAQMNQNMYQKTMCTTSNINLFQVYLWDLFK
jgi:hypothetical protein